MEMARKIRSFEDFRYTLQLASNLRNPIINFLTAKRTHINMLWDKYNEKDAFSSPKLHPSEKI